MEIKDYEKYMKKCLKLASKGAGGVSPNPMVGAILVNKKGEIIATGYHKGYGLNHAEVECIKNYENNGGKDFSDLTMFVNLEPCNHYGKTPPCADFIIKKGVKKVVIACSDPNPKHTGGAKKLKDAGIEVVSDILKDEAIKLNEVFFKNIKENLPFISIKTATTLDGKIASKTGSSKWITSKRAREYVQKLRNNYDGILTSSKTVIKDNPSLTARVKNGKNPVRIILDSNLSTNPDSKVYNNDGTKILLFYCKEKKHNKSSYPKNVKLIKANEQNGKIDLQDAVKKISKEGVNSILIEAGGILCAGFLNENLVDKIYQFIAPKITGDKSAVNFIEGFNISDINECRKFKFTTLKNLNPDIMLEYYPEA